MKSRFLEKLDAAIRSASDPLKRTCLSLEKASYLARRGDASESEEIVRSVRSEGHYLLSGEVGAWLNFTEGMQFHCAGNDPEAKQKWMRCLAIAMSVQAESILSRTSSWLAFIDYTSIRIGSLIANTRHAITCMKSDDFEAIARVSLTIAQGFHLCGNAVKAREFYDRCRLACMKSSDDVMLAALIHNMAWLRTFIQRNEMLQGLAATEDRYIVELGAESTRNYERLIGVKSLDVMTPLLGAQVDIISGRYSDAIRTISERLEKLDSQGLSRLNAVLVADRAYCRAESGDIDGAKTDAVRAREAVEDGDHVDDLAVLYTRLSRVYELAGDRDTSIAYIAKAKVHWGEFRILQNTLIAEINELPDFGAKVL